MSPLDLTIRIQLNLKNDTLRRRFDSLKYDMKKVEEGSKRVPFSYPVTYSFIVVYDVSLRKLAPSTSADSK
jgi:hypothetical protein